LDKICRGTIRRRAKIRSSAHGPDTAQHGKTGIYKIARSRSFNGGRLAYKQRARECRAHLRAEDDIEALKSQLAALADQLTALESRPLKVKYPFGEPQNTGWTPSKVVVLGNDAEGNLVELLSTIEPGGFQYAGTPTFWIVIG
jgi:hypothetical protein